MMRERSHSPEDIAVAILSQMPKGESKGDDGEDDADVLETAAGNILSASKSGSSKELASALKEFVQMCAKE